MLWVHRNRVGVCSLQVGCASLLMFFYIITNHLGLIAFYLAENGIKQLGTLNKQTVIEMAGYTSIVTLSYILADLLVRNFKADFRLVNIQTIRFERVHIFPLLVVTGLMTLISVLKFLDGSPLLLMLSGDVEAALSGRVSNYSDQNTFLGIKPSYLKVIFEVGQFATILVLAKFMALKSLKYLALYIIMTFVVMLDSMSNVSKGALLMPIYHIWLVYSMLYVRFQIVNKFVIWALLITFVVVSVVSAAMMGNNFISFFYPLERLMLGNLIPQYVVMDYFNKDNLLMGTSLPAWWSFGEHIQFPIDEFAWKELTHWAGGPYYTAPSSFVADSYANFHIYGVFGVSFIMFMLLCCIDLALMKIKSELVYVGLVGYCALHFSYLSAGGSLNFLFDYYAIASVLFALFFYKKYRLSLSISTKKIV